MERTGNHTKGGFFKYGPTVGAGWATVKLSPEWSENPRIEEVDVRLF